MGASIGTVVGLIKSLGTDPAVVQSAVDDWLDDHPEATTTVEDGAITYAKLNNSLQGSVDEISTLSGAISVSQPTAQESDVGKYLLLKSIDQNGKPTEFIYGDVGWLIFNQAKPTQTKMSGTSYGSVEVTDGTIELTAKGSAYGGSNGAYTFYGDAFDTEQGDKVYICAKASINVTNCDWFQLKYCNSEIRQGSPTKDQEYTISKVITCSDVTSKGSIRIEDHFSTRELATGSVYTVEDLIFVNLTKSFGAGNEPTKDEMDALVSENGYFETLNLFEPKAILEEIKTIESDIANLQGLESKIQLNVTNNWVPSADNDSGSSNVYSNSSGAVSLVKASSGMSGFVGHTLYVRGILKTTKDASVKVILNHDRETTSVTADTWTTISGEGPYLATNKGAGFDVSIAEGTGIKVYYKQVVLLDLTALYGAGNEPPKETLDLILNNASPESWSTQTINIFSPSVMKLSSARNLGSGLGMVNESQHVILSPDGNVQISSIANQNWSGWTEIGSYGQNRPTVIPIYNKVHGTIETDGMMSVIPIWGCWSDNASTTGNPYHGGHVFHGWTTDRLHRVTMVQNIYRSDEAALFNYIPGDKSGTNEGIFLRLRLGADNIGKGILIDNIYEYPGGTGTGGSYGDYLYTRVYVFGRLNIQNSPAGNIDQAGTGTGAGLPKNNIPASANAPGVKGDFTFDSNYAYFCTATDTWKRVPLESWS